MKTYWGTGVIAPGIKIGARCRRVISFTPGEATPGNHWPGGWVDPEAGLEAVAKRKIPSSYRTSHF